MIHNLNAGFQTLNTKALDSCCSSTHPTTKKWAQDENHEPTETKWLMMTGWTVTDGYTHRHTHYTVSFTLMWVSSLLRKLKSLLCLSEFTTRHVSTEWAWRRLWVLPSWTSPADVQCRYSALKWWTMRKEEGESFSWMSKRKEEAAMKWS